MNPIQVCRDGQEVIDYLSQQGTAVGKMVADAPPGADVVGFEDAPQNGI